MTNAATIALRPPAGTGIRMLPLAPLLLAAGILIGGNALQVTLVALSGEAAGFSPAIIGFMGTSYFAGFFLGCLFITPVMRAVGHIRAFAALAAIAACGSLIFAMAVDPVVWCLIRFVSGICFAGLFTIVEGWINAVVENHNRARVLAVYRIVDISAATSAQFLIPLFGASGFNVFAIMAIMITISLVPVSLGDRSNPVPPAVVKLDLKRAWFISPLAAFGCITVGVVNGAFRTVGPVYAQSIGFSVADAVTFMSLGIVGGALMQYPLGYLSDRGDRRLVLLAVTVCAMVVSFAMAMATTAGETVNLVLVFFYGAFAMTIYSLSVAHANDHADKDSYVVLSAALLLFYACGAIVGPFVASLLADTFGPRAFFLFIASSYGVFVVFTLVRLQMRGPAPTTGRFAAVFRTSPFMLRLSRRDSHPDDKNPS
jgi:MFS family permease